MTNLIMRREVITLLGSAVTWPRAALAQQPIRVRRIGWLTGGSGNPTRSFLQGMEQLGYVEGKNLMIEFRGTAGNNELFAKFAADLVRTEVELIVTVGMPATLAAKAATPTIPIVFAAAAAPMEKGVVSSLAQPGANVTGFATVIGEMKALEILKEAAPAISRAALLYDPDTVPGRFGDLWLSRSRDLARKLKIDLQPVILRHPNVADKVLAELPAGTDALVLSNNSINVRARPRLCTLAVQRRLATVSTHRGWPHAGCLASYGEDLSDMHRRAALYVDKILKGSKPADLPVQQPVKFDLVINLKTAGMLGLEVPPTLLARADEVID